jgi:hypothetical protein
MNTNAQTETTNEELAEMLHELSKPHLLIVSIVIDFFRARHWVYNQARRFVAWMAGKK